MINNISSQKKAWLNLSTYYRTWEATLDSNEDLDECIVHQSLRVKDFSLLSCTPLSGTSFIACCGGFANEKLKGNAFLGTPVYIVDTMITEET